MINIITDIYKNDNLFNNNKLETIRLSNINYHQNYNDIPQTLYISNHILFLKIHPHYCNEGNHYDKIYQYLYIENNIINNDIEIYVYDEGDIFTTHNLEFILNNLVYDIKLKYEDIIIKLSNINPSNYKNQMNNGQIPEEDLGFIKYKNQIYKIYKSNQELNTIVIPNREENYNEIDGLQNYITNQTVREPFNGFIGYVFSKNSIIGYTYSTHQRKIIISYLKQ